MPLLPSMHYEIKITDPNDYLIHACEFYNRECCWVLDVFRDRLEWSPTDLILEVGCSAGCSTFNCLNLAAVFKKLIGTDPNPILVCYAAQKYAGPKVSFKTFNIATLDDPLLFFDGDKIRKAGGFDKIFSFFNLHLVKNPERMAENFHKLLKPGGIGCVMLVVRCQMYNIWDTVSTEGIWGLLLDEDVETPINKYIYMDNYEEVFCQYLTDAGLTVLETRVEERKDAFPPKEEGCMTELTTRIWAIDPIRKHLVEEYQADWLSCVQLAAMRGHGPSGVTGYTALCVYFQKRR